MNSEELEQSLRTEFENYLRNTIAEMKQEVSDFEEKIQSEFEKHKSHIDDAFQEFSEKFGDGKEIEESFRDSVSEHLKLAREEGSKITANAFAEAEKLSEEEESDSDFDAVAHFADIRDAVDDISGQDSQSEILKSLVHHASQFTPRGAFFIVKNEHLVGWRIFGTEEHSNPQIVREVFFPVTSKTSLSEAIEALATVEGSSDANEDNLLYLNKLGFEEPEKMYAIPLVARGRGVAVLYADNGTEDGNVNVEALETMMRVAGLTVEVLASTQMAKSKASEKPAYVGSQEQTETAEETRYAEAEEEEEVSQPVFEEREDSDVADYEQADFSSGYESTDEVQTEDSEEDDTNGFDFQPVAEESEEESADEMSFEDDTEEVGEIAYGDTSWQQPVEEAGQDFSSTESIDEEYSTSYEGFDSGVEDSASGGTDYQAGINQPYEGTSEYESTQFESFTDTSVATEAAEDYSEVEEDSSETPYEFDTTDEADFDTVSDQSEATEQVSEETETESAEEVEETVSVPPVRTRFAERNVDLPIEVSEDERRLHNDARRFARLLVSEIKLYNEQKVKEGRESSDLYERLREAIDRSREMYDKRVQPPVAAKFDYFNYELVNTLADGDEVKLGGSYPGATI